MIGSIAGLVGAAGINIADMVVGQDRDGVSSLMMLATSTAVPESVVTQILAVDGVLTAKRIG